MKTVAVANLKGGVGKSTLTLLLAEHWALKLNLRVLVIDLDPQASVSYMLLSRRGIEACELANRTLPQAFIDHDRGAMQPLPAYIEHRASDLRELHGNSRSFVSLLPSVPSLWLTEYDYDRKLYSNGGDPVAGRRQLLQKFILKVQRDYECVLLDCPPGLVTLTRAALPLADHIISPTLLDDVSIRSTRDFFELGVERALGMSDADNRSIVVMKYQNVIEHRANIDALRKHFNVRGDPVPLREQFGKITRRDHGVLRTYGQKYEKPRFSPVSRSVTNVAEALARAIF
ncbi:MAG: ParA family protein [Hyphomicrobium sp.]|nr:ParA family protein [Hyphomicrobium sp.]